MRTRKIFIAMAMTTATFTLGACSNSDEVEVVDITKPIDLNIGVGGVTQTRVTIADNAKFEDGNSIGLFMGTLTTDETKGALGDDITKKFDNTKYTLSGSSWSGNSIYWQNTAEYHTLYAYSPYQENVTDYKIPFTLLANQADEKNYKAVDFLWKTATMKATSSSVPITLDHKMSLIKVNLKIGDDMTGEELKNLAMSILAPSEGIKAAGEFDLNGGACTALVEQTGTESLTSISPYRTANTFYAIVMPETVFKNASDFVKLTTTDGTTYLYQLGLSGNGDLTMEGGNKYEFTLKANKKGIALTQFNISAWGTGEGADGGADMVVPANL